MKLADELIARAEKREITFGIVGLGYVGLPLVVELARAGFKVLRAARRAGTRVLAEAVPSRPGSARGVHAFDLAAGVPVPVEVLAQRPGSFDLRLAGPAEGPVLLGLERADRGLSCRIVPTPAS